MGQDKALLDVGGASLLEAKINALQGAAAELVLCCGAEDRYEQLGVPLALDPEQGAGPLAGLAAAFRATQSAWLAVVACDMPLVGTQLLTNLMRHAKRTSLDGCLFRTKRGVEPLCAVYHRRCAPAVEAALKSGERRAISFHSFPGADGVALRLGSAAPVELGLTGAMDRALNLNTPADVDAWRLLSGNSERDSE